MLHRLGLLTVGDVAHTPLRTLQRAVGDGLGSQLHELAWGSDRREVTPGRVSVFGTAATRTSRWGRRRPSAATSTTAR